MADDSKGEFDTFVRAQLYLYELAEKVFENFPFRSS
jgi:hypothetical protein